MLAYLSWTSVVGALWTGALTAALARGKEGPLNSRLVLLANALLLPVTLRLVASGVDEVEAAAGGLKILDSPYRPYDTDYVLTFAEALGPDGRAVYASFQFGIDTWAPPVFAGLVACVACVTLPERWARAVLLLVGLYLPLAIASNAIGPAVMLNYPNVETPALRFLLNVMPRLDMLRNLIHFLAWGTIITGWIVTLVRHRSPERVER